MRRFPGTTHPSRSALALVFGACALAAAGAAHSKSELSVRPGPGASDAVHATAEEPEAFLVHIPDELAELPDGVTIGGLIASLAGSGGTLEQSDNRAVFPSANGAVILRLEGQTLIVSPPLEGSFSLDLAAVVIEPVLRVELAGRILRAHLLDKVSDTDAVVSIPIEDLNADRVKVKVFGMVGEELRARNASRAAIAEAIALAESALEAAAPGDVETAREAYSRIGALMVNHVREAAGTLPDDQAEAMCSRAQAVITAVLLRLYLTDNGDALSMLDSLREDPRLDRDALETFAYREGVSEEFDAIWPQCGCEE